MVLQGSTCVGSFNLFGKPHGYFCLQIFLGECHAMPEAQSDDETQALAWPKAARAIQRNATILKAAAWMKLLPLP